MKKKIFIPILMSITTNILPYDYLPDEVPLNKALIAIAHNSPQSEAYGWVYAQQHSNLAGQWKAGARGAKINLHWRKPVSKKTPFIALCHEPDGGNNCQLSVIQLGLKQPRHATPFFSAFAKLLKENPKDVAIIILEDYLDNKTEKNGAKKFSDAEVNAKLETILTESGLAEYALKLNNSCYSPQYADWPTVGEMRKTNKRLLIFVNNYSRAKASKILNNWGASIAKIAHWEYVWREAIKNHTCKMWQNPAKAKAFVIGNGPEVSLEKGSLGGLIGRILKKCKIEHVEGPTDYSYVNSINIIKQRCNDCEKAGGYPPSIIGLDFIDKGKAYQAIKEINQARFPGKIK